MGADVAGVTVAPALHSTSEIDRPRPGITKCTSNPCSSRK